MNVKRGQNIAKEEGKSFSSKSVLLIGHDDGSLASKLGVDKTPFSHHSFFAPQ